MPIELPPPDSFVPRHIGPRKRAIEEMLQTLGVEGIDALIDQVVPSSIRLRRPLRLPAGKTEAELLAECARLAALNQVYRSYIGLGYADCVTPPVILRNILENPGWYTQYTPYQAEISQGRLEALLNFQTMIADLTGFPIANASLLDEGTAAAEAMTMLAAVNDAVGDSARTFWVSSACLPQTIAVVKTRAEPLGIEVVVADHATVNPGSFDRRVFGVLLQYPTCDGDIPDYRDFIAQAHAAGALVVLATDLLSLALLTPPGELGADVAVGSAQRFGVPMGYGGPHAAFFATRAEYTRKLPGRLIGVSQDAHGHLALRMALQTREQHIRREKATSNICTAQVLLAVMASMYAVYHGPEGLRHIAERIAGLTAILAQGLNRLGWRVRHAAFFDTIVVAGSEADVARWHAAAEARRMNLRHIDATTVGISLDETTSTGDVQDLWAVFSGASAHPLTVADVAATAAAAVPVALRRTSAYLQHSVFNSHRSETEMLRYIKRLESRDLSLTHSMIPLGSCTMKLNAAAEMLPVTWPAWGRLHPFAPLAQTAGYQQIFQQLRAMLGEITGFPGISLQPNAGSQGEYAGLLVIRKYHQSRGDADRDVCLIPSSAHGTNPASAVLAGYRVVVVACDDAGNVDLVDLEGKARVHRHRLAALMITYPSTHGVFEEDIQRICQTVHEHGGLVYMDGANMNAQVGLCRPADFGADVCHLNLHKTFCIPHGGGGPGMGPIGVAAHLERFLPGHPLVNPRGGDERIDSAGDRGDGIGPVSSAPWGSASILLISWAYITMMGGEGLTQATQIAILNANYIARRLGAHYPVFYTGKGGRVAHECILDMRHLKRLAGIEVEDIAKRLMDYGYHAPTMSFPIPSTMMVEPTESEGLPELDQFCDAMISIRNEIHAIAQGQSSREDNPLKNAPHTAAAVTATTWEHPYSREQAAFPSPATRAHKFWPPVGRLNNVLGDRKLFCVCPPVDSPEPVVE
jgi:glycine dehydrogenase